MKDVFGRIVAVAAICICSAGAVAQETTDIAQTDVERFERALREADPDYLLLGAPEMTLGERITLDFGAVASFNFFAIDDIDQKTHILRQYDNKFFADLNIDGVHEFYGRLRYTYLDFNEGDSFDGLGDEYVYPIADRWWYRFDLGRAIETSSGQTPWFDADVKVGRQWVDWASGLTFSDELYAARGSVEAFNLRLEGLAGLTPSSSVIDFDSSRPDFDAETDRQFYGLLLAYEGMNDHRPYVYALHQIDRNDHGPETITIAPGGVITPIPTRFDYNSTYLGVGATGELFTKLTYEVEFVYEKGEGLSTSVSPSAPAPAPQSREDIEAWAAKAEFNYHLRDASRTQVDFETIFASGDDDRVLDTSNTFGGNQAGTHDQAFNAFGYARTGYAFAAPISNMMLFRVGASTYPMTGAHEVRNLRLGVDFFVFNKLDSDAPIDEATSDDRFLGTEVDVYATWRILSDVSLSVRYGVFFPGKAIEADNDARHFLFTGITYSF